MSKCVQTSGGSSGEEQPGNRSDLQAQVPPTMSGAGRGGAQGHKGKTSRQEPDQPIN